MSTRIFLFVAMKTFIIPIHKIDKTNLSFIYWHDSKYSIMLSEPGIEYKKDYRPYNFIIFNSTTLNQVEIQEFLKKRVRLHRSDIWKGEIIKSIETVESYFPKANLLFLCNKSDPYKNKILKYFPEVKLKFI